MGNAISGVCLDQAQPLGGLGRVAGRSCFGQMLTPLSGMLPRLCVVTLRSTTEICRRAYFACLSLGCSV